MINDNPPKILAAMLFTASGLLSVPALAEPGFYLGLKAGTVSIDEDKIDDLKNTAVDIKDDTMGGLILGYTFNDSVAVELDVAGSEHDVENVPGYDSIDLGLLGLYVAWRSQGQFYGKLRGGLLSRSIELNPTNPSNPFTPEEDDNASSVSVSFGGGFRLDQFQIEAEFTTVEEGVNTFGIAGIYNF